MPCHHSLLLIQRLKERCKATVGGSKWRHKEPPTTGHMHRNRRFLAHQKHEVFLSGPVAQNGIVVPLVQMGKLSHSACSSSHFVRDFAHLVCKASLGAVPLTMLFPTKVFSLNATSEI